MIAIYLARIMGLPISPARSADPHALHTRSSIDAQLEADHHSYRLKIGRIALLECEADGEDVYKVERLVQRWCCKVYWSCLP